MATVQWSEWNFTTMKWLAYILWFLAAVFFIWEQVKDKPGKRQTVREMLIRWRMRIIAAIIAALAVCIHQYPQDSKIPSENLNELTCNIDTVKSLLQKALGSPDKEYLEAARQEAACIDASELAQTANDSGLVALGLAKYSAAIIHFQYAIIAAEDNRSRGTVYANIALTHLLWGNSLSSEDEHDDCHSHLAKAVIYYDSSLVYKYNDAEAWYNRGIALDDLGEFMAAVASYDSALVCKYDLAEAWNNRGVALDHLGKSTAAVASFDSALVYKYDFAEAWNSRGNALSDLGEFKAAVASFDSALVYKYDFAIAWNSRGNALRSLGDFKEAVASFDSAIVYAYDFTYAWYNRGGALYNLGEFTAAVASFDSALVYKYDFAVAWSTRGDALSRLRDFKAAVASYDSAIVYDYDFAYAWYNRGYALKRLGDFKAAAASCDSALKYDPGWKEALELKKTIQENLK